MCSGIEHIAHRSPVLGVDRSGHIGDGEAVGLLEGAAAWQAALTWSCEVLQSKFSEKCICITNIS